MEKVGISDRKTVIIELTQGKKLANELRKQLLPNPANNPGESTVFLLEKILSSYDSALVHLGFPGNGKPKSELADKHVSKKRKITEKWREKVRVSSCTGFEGQLDDGYNWRKYGQKDILGANHPRAYYRCTHRHTQGCLATKQVQQTDENPSTFEVIYQRTHSCTQERLKQKKENLDLQTNEKKMILSKEPNFKIGILELDDPKEENTTPLSISSTPTEPENVETQISSELNYFTGTSSSAHFFSPTSSESYLSMDDFGLDDIFQSSGLDLSETFLNPTPAATFKFHDWDIEHVDFDAHFFDVPRHFS